MKAEPILNKEERKLAYAKALKIHEKDLHMYENMDWDCPYGICTQLLEACKILCFNKIKNEMVYVRGNDVNLKKELAKQFPELAKHMPLIKNFDGPYWFPRNDEGHAKRIEILTKISH